MKRIFLAAMAVVGAACGSPDLEAAVDDRGETGQIRKGEAWSSADNTCSAPPTASGPTGASA